MFDGYWLRDIRTSGVACGADQEIDVKFFPIAIDRFRSPWAFGETIGYVSEDFAKELEGLGMKRKEY